MTQESGSVGSPTLTRAIGSRGIGSRGIGSRGIGSRAIGSRAGVINTRVLGTSVLDTGVIDTSIIETNDRIVRIEEKIDMLLEQINKIEKVLFLGNGTPSVLARLTRIEESNINTGSVIKWIVGIVAIVIAAVIVEFIRGGK